MVTATRPLRICQWGTGLYGQGDGVDVVHEYMYTGVHCVCVFV